MLLSAHRRAGARGVAAGKGHRLGQARLARLAAQPALLVARDLAGHRALAAVQTRLELVLAVGNAYTVVELCVLERRRTDWALRQALCVQLVAGELALPPV